MRSPLAAVPPLDLPGEPAQASFQADLQRALAEPPHAISPKYFYDAEGSRLFDRICELPEYYPTRTERAILQRHAADIAAQVGAGSDLVEFGAGSCSKVRLLLPELQPRRYLPIDISAQHLQQAAVELVREHPGLVVVPLAGDYLGPVRLPPALPGARRVGFFPGSTIGNFTPDEALHFLRGAARLLQGGGLLLGADLVKDPAVLHAAYNDAQGVTAAFNLNLLARANRELGTDFDLARLLAQRLLQRRRSSASRCTWSAAGASRCALAGQRYDLPQGPGAAHGEFAQVHRRRGCRRWPNRPASGPRRCGPTSRRCSACTG